MQLHSWDHDATHPQLSRCSEELRAALVRDARATLYRPPGSTRLMWLDAARRVAREFALPTVNPYDFTRPTAAEPLRRVLAAVKPSCVVLLHSGVRETLDALPEIMRSLKRRGFQCGELH